MTNHLEFYRCEICGNIVQVMHAGAGELVCCGKAMSLLKPFSQKDEKQEKHVPVFVENKIKVGSEPHPMLPEHHIEFIQAISEDKKCIKTKFLNTEQEPSMTINSDDNFNSAFEYCNIHGLWYSEQ